MFFPRYLEKHPYISLSNSQKEAIKIFKEKVAQRIYRYESASCLCGSTNGKLISISDRYGLEVPTYICKNCGVLWTNPRLDEESLGMFYDNDYRSIYVDEKIGYEEFFQNQIINGNRIFNFLSTANNFTEKKVFDIGCGAGGALIPFIRNGWQGYGCDLGDQYLEIGRGKGLTLEKGGIDSLSKYGKADLIILSHVLEHIANPHQLLKKISENLSTPGYVYIELPGLFVIHKSYRYLINFLQNAHLYHYCLGTLTDLLRSSGFELVKGNESVQSVFVNSKAPINIQKRNFYRKTLSYLVLVEILGSSQRKINSFRNLFRRTIKMTSS